MSGWLLWPLVAGAVGVTAATGILFRRSRRERPEDRRGWATAFTALMITCVSCVALLLGLPDTVYWLVLHPLIISLFGISLARAPGPRRSQVNRPTFLLDGSVLTGGFVMLAWLVMHAQSVVPLRTGYGSVTGVAGVAALVSHSLGVAVMAGLLARSTGRRPGLAAICAAGFLTLTGHVVAVTTDRALLGVPFWLAGALGSAAAARLLTDLHVMADDEGTEEPRRVRLWQLPILPGTWFILSPAQQTTTTRLMAVALMLGTFMLLVGYSRQTLRLWSTLVARTERHDQILRDSRDVIVQIDELGMVEFASAAAGSVLGIEPGRLVGTSISERFHPDDMTTNRELGQRLRRPTGPAADRTPRDGLPALLQEARFRYAEREWRYIEWTISPRAEGGGWVLSGRDISERVQLREELAHQSRTDSLTGLLNRAAFLAEVDARLAAGRRTVVLLLDLDHFKPVNDTLGQARGDELLQRVATRLAESTSPSDVLARLGSDEFGVLPMTDDVAAAELMAGSLVAALSGMDAGARGREPVTASVGIAAGALGSAAALLRDADLAMYRAKRLGGAVTVFEPWMSERVIERSREREELETVVHSGGLAVHLQPVVDLQTGRWTGFEALIRWPVAGELRPPARFLPLAEETGLIVPMGTWVLVESLRLLAQWADPTAGVAVNVSALQLVEHDFPGIVLGALEAIGIEPGRLTLEITEQAAVQDLSRTASRLAPLRDLGVHVAVDDFGTGFSSLQYLSRLPVDILKIDRRFISGLGQEAEDEVLVRSMIRLGADLGMDVIAEGVETVEQADLLRRFGCRLAQGYLFAPPRSLEELAATVPTVPVGVPRPRGTATHAPGMHPS